MNIYEMLSFDFQEFVTSPAGILIIIGIICLLVGIVIFLKEGKKAAKPAEEVKEEAAPAEPQVAAEAKPEEAAPAPVEEPAVTPVVEPIQEATPVVVNATADGVNEVPVPAVAETLNITEPAPAVVSPVEEIKPETLDAPAPAVEAPAVEPAPVVYGGASPEVSEVVTEEAPKEIYGGANPLENTAPIPTAAIQEAAAAAPAPEAPAPVEAPAAPAPETPKEEIEKLEF